MTYDTNNVFARIIRGELPCHKVYEDARTLAIMDISPMVRGHVLVLPKAPARNLLDVAEADLAAVALTVKRMAIAVKKAFAAEGVTIQHFSEPAAGQTVFHLHVHVLPRWASVPLRPAMGPMEKPEILAAEAERIRAALA